MVNGRAMLDLDYSEDSCADVDMNLAMTGEEEFLEIQGSSEGKPFGPEELQQMLDLGRCGITRLLKVQKRALAGEVIS
jgi:ribonuclease PH